MFSIIKIVPVLLQGHNYLYSFANHLYAGGFSYRCPDPTAMHCLAVSTCQETVQVACSKTHSYTKSNMKDALTEEFLDEIVIFKWSDRIIITLPTGFSIQGGKNEEKKKSSLFSLGLVPVNFEFKLDNTQKSSALYQGWIKSHPDFFF